MTKKNSQFLGIEIWDFNKNLPQNLSLSELEQLG